MLKLSLLMNCLKKLNHWRHFSTYDGTITNITKLIQPPQKAARLISRLGIARNNEIDEIKNGQEKIQDIKEKEE